MCPFKSAKIEVKIGSNLEKSFNNLLDSEKMQSGWRSKSVHLPLFSFLPRVSCSPPTTTRLTAQLNGMTKQLILFAHRIWKGIGSNSEKPFNNMQHFGG